VNRRIAADYRGVGSSLICARINASSGAKSADLLGMVGGRRSFERGRSRRRKHNSYADCYAARTRLNMTPRRGDLTTGFPAQGAIAMISTVFYYIWNVLSLGLLAAYKIATEKAVFTAMVKANEARENADLHAQARLAKQAVAPPPVASAV
jgi:hypothetical protein